MLIDLPSTRPVFAYAQDYLHGERVELMLRVAWASARGP